MTERRHGDWMATHSGQQFWPLDPRAEEVVLEDIAHSLAMQCRFAGHTRMFYSVAQHSVLVSLEVEARTQVPLEAFWGLLHDASEAYLLDVPRPVKRHLEGYVAHEARVMAAICKRFRLEGSMPRSVKEVDNVLLATEIRDLMPKAPWEKLPDPRTQRINPWAPEDAKLEFLYRYRNLIDVIGPR